MVKFIHSNWFWNRKLRVDVSFMPQDESILKIYSVFILLKSLAVLKFSKTIERNSLTASLKFSLNMQLFYNSKCIQLKMSEMGVQYCF